MYEMIVNGYVYPNVDLSLLAQTAPDLTFLSLFSYGITENGGLTPLDVDPIVETVKPYGVAPLMTVTTLVEEAYMSEVASSVLKSRENQDRLIDNILAEIQAKDLYGVDFDLEYINPEDRDDYSTLVNRAKERLNPLGYVVMTAVAPKTSGDQRGLLYEGHDYGGLGAAANFVLLMTYEWGYAYGPPMAIAPLDQVRLVVEYAVNQMPASKILLGIPNYAYDWTLPYVAGETRAKNLSQVEARELADQVGAVIQYDEKSQSPHFGYLDADGREHEVWFEDERSINAKLDLVEEYKLAGVGYWNLMRAFPDNWRIVNERVNVVKVV